MGEETTENFAVALQNGANIMMVAGEQETIMINGGGGGYLVELSLEEFGKALPYELMPLKK